MYEKRAGNNKVINHTIQKMRTTSHQCLGKCTTDGRDCHMRNVQLSQSYWRLTNWVRKWTKRRELSSKFKKRSANKNSSWVGWRRPNFCNTPCHTSTVTGILSASNLGGKSKVSMWWVRVHIRPSHKWRHQGDSMHLKLCSEQGVR